MIVRSTRQNVYVNYLDRVIRLADLCREQQVSLMLVYTRLKRGWPLEKALKKPARYRNPVVRS
jgi:hypothetical protein